MARMQARSLWTLLLILPLYVWAQECATDGTCDKHERCPVWKEEGECLRSKSYMDVTCPVSCSTVDLTSSATKATECEDAHPRCPVWADLGECADNFDMRRYCAKSCNSCREASTHDVLCSDSHENCPMWANMGECSGNPEYMLQYCAKSCGACQKEVELSSSDIDILDATEEFGVRQRADGNEYAITLRAIRESVEYMNSDQVKELPAKLRENCRNQNELCSFWSHAGECEANQSYMKINCAPACKSCHLIDMATRCPRLSEEVNPPALRPGDLNKMFERIIATAPGNRTLSDLERQTLQNDGITEYSVHVHSQPQAETTDLVSLENDVASPPWVITFDNFVTPEECETIIKLGYDSGYKRSEDVGEEKPDGTLTSVQSVRRTSENAWCTKADGCRQHPAVSIIQNRIAQVLSIPADNSEDLQVLRYEIGQFYRTHHDYIIHQKDRQCGPRILTFFIYLSDVKAGGGTNFPELNITVMPKMGRALLWPSVYNSDPRSIDSRTTHQALPVEAGTKFAANGWIHLHDYIGPQERGCT